MSGVDKNDLRLLCDMLDGLALLPVSEVPSGMECLRGVAPALDGVTQLLDYFDGTYVTGTAQRIQRPQTSPGIAQLSIAFHQRFRWKS